MVIAKESINLLSNSIEPDLGQAARRGFLPRRAVLRSPPPTHNGSSVNFLGDGTIFWGDGTEFRTASVMLFIRLPEGPKKRNQVTHMF